ncbi:DUF6338 family protein [Phenylobacterium sp.]|uniref:DUF6338 family protein n=1 Tax=Phenylobacterium sp. TaxID=1871053 RepID=UPI00394893DE
MDGLSDLAALKPHQLWAVIVLFLPGFISLKLHRFIEQKQGTAAEALIDVVGFSLLNAAVLFWPIYLASIYLALPDPNYTYAIKNAFWVCVAGPVAWPIVFQLVRRFALRGGWLLGEQKSAFDAFFSTGQPCWVIVHLPDGSSIGGYFGSSSFASAHPHQGDFYLEELWELDDAGGFRRRIPNSKGALFQADDYVWLEFYWDQPAGQENENGRS